MSAVHYGYLARLSIFKKVQTQLRQRPHYAGGIRKRSFISMVRPTVHTSPLRNRSFSKTLFKQEEFENACFSFSCGRKTF